MQSNEILCKETGKILKADKIFKVRNKEENCIEEIVTYCTLCPYSENKKAVGQACKKCYGTIAQSRKTFKIKGNNKNMTQVENYRNKFEVNELGEYLRDMDADMFMQTIDKIANLNTLNWNHDGRKTDDKLRAYDKPKSWKTDCQMCKQKCAKSNSIPECEKAKQYLEEKFGNSIEFMSEKQLLSEIPGEFICKNQAQTMYFV
jgi:hypothetical protein